MPNRINATILLVLIALGIQAQNFNAGFTLGIAATQVDGDGYGGFDKAGPVGGIWVSSNFHRNWFGRMELRYTQKGSYAKTSTETSSFYRMRLHYFEIPLLIGYRIVNGFQAIVGLSAGYLGSAQEMTDLGSFPDEDIDAFKKFELAEIVGIEYNYSENWAIGTYFSYSLAPIRKHRGSITYRLDKGQYNQVLELIVRYKI